MKDKKGSRHPLLDARARQARKARIHRTHGRTRGGGGHSRRAAHGGGRDPEARRPAARRPVVLRLILPPVRSLCRGGAAGPAAGRWEWGFPFPPFPSGSFGPLGRARDHALARSGDEAATPARAPEGAAPRPARGMNPSGVAPA